MIKGMHHVAISVQNLHRSLRFYRDLLGMKIVAQGVFEGEKYETILGIKGARGEVVSLRMGSMQLELFEFSHPVPRAQDRTVYDHGIAHFCIEVDDIDAEYERLRGAGIAFHCPPLEFFHIMKATYGKDPDGNVFELLQIY